VLSENGDIVHFSRTDKEQCIAGDTDASSSTDPMNVIYRFARHVILNYPVNVRQIQASSCYILQCTIYAKHFSPVPTSDAAICLVVHIHHLLILNFN